MVSICVFDIVILIGAERAVSLLVGNILRFLYRLDTKIEKIVPNVKFFFTCSTHFQMTKNVYLVFTVANLFIGHSFRALIKELKIILDWTTNRIF